jgi:hypothetical protein
MRGSRSDAEGATGFDEAVSHPRCIECNGGVTFPVEKDQSSSRAGAMSELADAGVGYELRVAVGRNSLFQVVA